MNKIEQKETDKKARKEGRSGISELLKALTLTGFIYGPLDERLDLKDAIEKNLYKPVPKHVNFTGCFGGIALFIFILQVMTGIMLMLYYKPTTDEAFNSVMTITNDVPFGWLIRGLHFWGANLMILVVMLHMLKVFITGAYKKPRDFNWVIGIILLMLTLGFAFTGYLLPWNQISYWATTVGTEIPGAIPFIGKDIVSFIRGGEEISPITLTRFFAVHIVILPIITVVFMIMHFIMIRKLGISGPL
jgi:quinol-cytochrome oxidoreductase complex cytochrome b subunit